MPGVFRSREQNPKRGSALRLTEHDKRVPHAKGRIGKMRRAERLERAVSPRPVLTTTSQVSLPESAGRRRDQPLGQRYIRPLDPVAPRLQLRTKIRNAVVPVARQLFASLSERGSARTRSVHPHPSLVAAGSVERRPEKILSIRIALPSGALSFAPASFLELPLPLPPVSPPCQLDRTPHRT